jgi:hypothetical protein
MALVRVSQPDPLRTTSAAVATVTNGVRATGESVGDAQESLAAQGTPASWSGDASEAARNEFTALSGRLDSASAAFVRAVTVLDAFDDTVQTLNSRRTDLVEEVSNLNGRIDAYDADVAASDKDDAAAQEALVQRSAALEREATALQADVDAWNSDQESAEQTVIAGLQGVDTVAEGASAASDPNRPDADALADQLQQRVDAGDPQAVADWWSDLSPEQVAALVMHSPQLVGNAGGVPSEVRDEANRTSMLSDIDYLTQRRDDGQLTDLERQQLMNAEDARDTLDGYGERVDLDTGENLAHLLVYRPSAFDGDGGVAVSLGDPDTADDVSSFVPGLTNEATSLSGNLDSMDRLHELADDKNGDRTTASIVWIDYDAPSSAEGFTDDPWDFIQVAGQGKATEGGERFADFVDGLRASDHRPPGEDAHFTAIGHSYGSTTVSHAATDNELQVDDMVLIGSPGTGSAQTATDLMPEGHLFVGSADYDPVTLLGAPGIGALGHDPAQADFGAHRFEVDPGSYRVQDLLENHSSYFNEGSTSLDAMSDVVAGRTPDEVDGRTLGSTQPLDTLLVGTSLASGGEQVWNGVAWTGERVADGAGWAWDRAKDAGSWLNPLD